MSKHIKHIKLGKSHKTHPFKNAESGGTRKTPNHILNFKPTSLSQIPCEPGSQSALSLFSSLNRRRKRASVRFQIRSEGTSTERKCRSG
ncbi:hypothetical protein HanRHA438_Chr16g0767821 [Helianthus annuus]|nr:hypothetical protein HanRHA438_Chr16g0767821 [Helianthus annuus]